MKNKNFIKAIGIAVTVIGFGVSILTDWVNEKKMDKNNNEREIYEKNLCRSAGTPA